MYSSDYESEISIYIVSKTVKFVYFYCNFNIQVLKMEWNTLPKLENFTKSNKTEVQYEEFLHTNDLKSHFTYRGLISNQNFQRATNTQPLQTGSLVALLQDKD